jgi:hypothetical protein
LPTTEEVLAITPAIHFARTKRRIVAAVRP